MSIRHLLKSLATYWVAAMSTSNMAMSLVAQETPTLKLGELVKLDIQQSTKTECCVCC